MGALDSFAGSGAGTLRARHRDVCLQPYAVWLGGLGAELAGFFDLLPPVALLFAEHHGGALGRRELGRAWRRLEWLRRVRLAGGWDQPPAQWHGHPEQGFNRFGSGNQPAAQAFNRPPVRREENYAYNRGGESANRATRAATGRPAHGTTPNRLTGSGGTGGKAAGVCTAGRRVRVFFKLADGLRSAALSSLWRPAAGLPCSAANYQRNDFAQRSYAEPRSYGGQRSFAESAPKQRGGSHLFGGGHGGESYKASYKAPKMPKTPKAPKMSGGGGRHGGGGHSGGGLFGHHGR